MIVYLNGEEKSLDDGLKLGDLINQLELGGKRLAVEINQEIVPKSQHGEYELKPGDKIEIVHAIGGG